MKNMMPQSSCWHPSTKLDLLRANHWNNVGTPVSFRSISHFMRTFGVEERKAIIEIVFWIKKKSDFVMIFIREEKFKIRYLFMLFFKFYESNQTYKFENSCDKCFDNEDQDYGKWWMLKETKKRKEWKDRHKEAECFGKLVLCSCCFGNKSAEKRSKANR